MKLTVTDSGSGFATFEIRGELYPGEMADAVEALRGLQLMYEALCETQGGQTQIRSLEIENRRDRDRREAKELEDARH